jgi:hypothetical protein
MERLDCAEHSRKASLNCGLEDFYVSWHEEAQKFGGPQRQKRCSPSAHQELEVDSSVPLSLSDKPFVSSPYLSLGGQDLLSSHSQGHSFVSILVS